MIHNIFTVEGISGSQKSEFCELLFSRISKNNDDFILKSFIGCRNINSLRNKLILSKNHDQFIPYLLYFTDFYQFFEDNLVIPKFPRKTIILERYLANLYALLAYNKGDVSLLNLFSKYPATFTFFLDRDPSDAYDYISEKRVISYWETNLSEYVDTNEIRDDIASFYRGKYSTSEIKKFFISYQEKMKTLIIKYLRDKPHIIIENGISLDEKVNIAIDEMKKNSLINGDILAQAI